MSSVSRGNTKDVRSRQLLEDEGYTVGSRRHIPGPGDLLAVDGFHAPLLAEVKLGAGSPWENFRRDDRREMVEFAKANGLVPVLLFWQPRARRHRMIFAEDWPA